MANPDAPGSTPFSSTTIVIPGTEQAFTETESVRAYFPEAQIQSFSIEAFRSAGTARPRVDIATTDVVVTKFENNIRWFHSGGDFVAKLREQQPPTRSGTSMEMEVPLYWQDTNAATSRGLFTSLLKLVGVDLVKKTGAGKLIADDIAHRIEQNNPNILYSCDENFSLYKKFDAATARNVSGRYLLLIHGTGSNTRSGFGGLANIKTGNLYKTLYDYYGGRIIAYEHKTFSQNPVQNVYELVQQLPDNITLDLLSHSRGGLLGEILARISSEDFAGVFTPDEMQLLEQNEDAADLVTDIKKLNGLAGKKKLNVNMFVRVACPAAGTTLVSNRADNILNTLFNLLSNLPGEITSTIVDGLQALVMAVVNEKNSSGALPGIECMKPDSVFIKVLNYSPTKIDSPLIVIAGDSQGDGFIGKMKMLLVDSFYREDNDLVVNTASMKKGTGRKTPFFIYDDQVPATDHFNYFINLSTKNVIQSVLTGRQADIQGRLSSSTMLRSALTVPEVNTIATRSASSMPNQPVLYVLPGIMGSDLQAGNQSIWLNYFQMLKGGLKKLDIAATDVAPTGINGKAYSKLVDYFSNDYYVVPFPYDWRKSIYEAAAQLKAHIEDAFKVTDKTISFVVHSMGGLVFRAFVTEYEDVWKKLLERPGCRVLMLGTPNFGSYVIPRLLTGNDKSLNALAALDLTQNKKSLLQQFVHYSGMLELLPVNDTDNFSDMSIFQKMIDVLGLDYPIPVVADMSGYLKMRADKFRKYEFDTSIVKYIAGKDDKTPSGYDITGGKLNFQATPQGDGSVTWSSIPTEFINKQAIYYIPAEHGSMAKHSPSFDGFKELLSKGDTRLLSTIPPATRAALANELMPEQEQVITPDASTLQDYVMGITVAPEKTVTRQIQVSITHGDLGHAQYPLVVGHFKGDGIVEAERVLDRKLNGYLSVRHATGNYPTNIGTHTVILNRDTKPVGAIVAGLGDFGELTENLLEQTLKQALMSYVVKTREDETSNMAAPVNGALDDTADTLGISYLLVGSGFGGLSIVSSIKAIVKAVLETNSFFEKNMQTGYKAIGQVEIVELYQHKAVQAGRTLFALMLNNDISGKVSFAPNTIRRASGARTEIPDEIQTGWWQRLKIAQAEEMIKNGIKIERGIAFSSITDKARSEEVRLKTNISIVDRLIAQAASVSNNNPLLGQTLYELLVPNEFKGYGTDLRNLVLVLDEETARYPWEMMLDGTGGNREPIVTKTGFLRQLSTSSYRLSPRITAVNNALVIGNPKLGPTPQGGSYYPPLPGASNEATKVAEQLSQGGYAVKPYTFIEADAFDMLPTLYTIPFKIMHIAAHGVVNDRLTGQTGVVLGTGLILTSSDFEQMRNVPELVFINCCSLGVINKEDEERLQSKYKVAAGIGTQLIKMGVKAVIVAGWEVDDAAALNFSETFYRQLLSGKNYGDAVKEARSSTYDNFGDRNTWGAYQCYGDPFYTLRPVAGAAARSYRFCDPVEAISKLQNLVSEIESATGQEQKDAIAEETKCILKAVNEHPEWIDDAIILEQLAQLYKELGNYPEAIKYYEQLFSLEDASYTIRSVEQYCNISVKQIAEAYEAAKAVQTATGTTATGPVATAEPTAGEAAGQPETTEQKDTATIAETALERILSFIDTLQAINQRLGTTSERLSIMGSAYRRLAEISKGDKDTYLGYLALSAYFYYKGYQVFLSATGKVHSYPLYNWLIINSIIGQIGGITQKAAALNTTIAHADQKGLDEAVLLPVSDSLMKLLQDATDYAMQREKREPGYWTKTVDITRYLFRLIGAKTSAEIEECKNGILTSHKNASKVEGSINKKHALVKHIEFVISALELLKTEADKSVKLLPAKLKALREIIAALG